MAAVCAGSLAGVAERDDDERRDENVEAIANAAGALLGNAIAGPLGGVIGAGLGPKLKRLVRGVWAELSASARKRQTDVLFWAIRAGVPVDEMEARINASKRTELLTGVALDAASRTAWEDKVRTLGRSLAAGLLADDNATIDTEQMIIAAIADIEGPHLAMLELLVAWRPGRNVAEPLISGPLDLPRESHERPFDDSWDVAWRDWSRRQIAHARPNLAPFAPSLLGTLQRHGLAVQNDKTGEAIEEYAQALEKQIAEYERQRATGAHRFRRPPGVPTRRNQRRGPRGRRPSWASRCSSGSMRLGRNWRTCGLQARMTSRNSQGIEHDAPSVTDRRASSCGRHCRLESSWSPKN